MIFVAQGYEKGIGLPLFLKAMASFSKKDQSGFTLFCSEETFQKVLATISLSSSAIKNMHIHFFSTKKTVTTTALEQSYSACKKGDVLLTLPTIKKHIYFNNRSTLGHTDYFRKKTGKEEISMVFHFKHCTIMMLTDHIPLHQVIKKINARLLKKKLHCVLTGLQNFLYAPEEVLFSGINPHCGEEGLLGDDDQSIKDFIQKNKIFNDIPLAGPYSGDSLFYRYSKRSLLVYAYHDQGLSAFKARFGLYGLHMTLGLPFLRVSPDFGTGLGMDHFNKAHYGSMIYLLKFLMDRNGNQYD